MAKGASNAPYMGFEKEPATRFGPKESGRALVHSHSKRPKSKIGVRSKRHGRKN